MSETTEQPTADLRTLRLRQGLTLRDLAAKCAEAGVTVHFTELARYERGESVPNPARRVVLVKLYGVDEDYFERSVA